MHKQQNGQIFVRTEVFPAEVRIQCGLWRRWTNGWVMVSCTDVSWASLLCLYLVGGMTWRLLKTPSPGQRAAWNPVEISGLYYSESGDHIPDSNSRLPPLSIIWVVLCGLLAASKRPQRVLEPLSPQFLGCMLSSVSESIASKATLR